MGVVDERTRQLARLSYASAAVEECLSSLRDAVLTARSAGVSWAEVATILDTTEADAAARFRAGGSLEAQSR